MEVAFKNDNRRENPFLKFIKDLGKKMKNFKVPSAFYYFLILIAIGFAFYFYMLVENNFSLAYGGDYSAQYIPMGYHIWDYYHEWFRTGHFTLFDSTLFLGANSFGSNAYYGLFSPFNIIIVIFPRTMVPTSVAISSIIKLAVAGIFFAMYMKRAFGVKEKVANICGIAYAFAGWGAFYLWYNNYQDILVFFPLVLLGIERTIKDEKPWLLAVGVFFLSICNYVLMVPYIICAFFYAMFRFFQQIKTRKALDNLKVLGLGFIGFAGGLLMALFVVAPAFMATMSSPKLDVKSYGTMLKEYLLAGKIGDFFKLLFSWKVAADQHNRIIPNRVWYPILEFFFPATTCRSLPSFEMYSWDFDDMAVSLWCYVPFIMFLVPALIQSGKEKKWSHYIGFALLTLTLFTPFMYFLTMGFSNGYARWTLFIASSLIAYVGIYIDKIPNVSRWHMHIGFAFAVVGIIAAWILTWKIYVPNTDKSGDYMHRFVEGGYDFTNIVFIGELIYVLGVYLTLFFLYYKKAFHILASVFVAAEAIAMGNFVTEGHGWDTSYNNGYAENERFKEVLDKTTKGDNSYYRIYSSIGDSWSVNNSFINNYRSVSFFHSLYNFEIDDFTLWTGIRNGSKSVSGNYRGKYQDLDNLLGVKYYFISKRKSKYNFIESNNPGGYIANVPFDFEEKPEFESSDSDYLVFENKNLNGFGYSYDTIYNGVYPDDSEGARFDVECIKSTISLAETATLKEEDAAEIQELYPDINIITERPVNTTLKQLRGNTDYYYYFYDMESTAKYYPFKDIPAIQNTHTAGTFYSDHTMNYYAFVTTKNASEPLIKAGTTLYMRAPFSGSQKYDIYFLDGMGEDSKIFMFDAHDDDTSDNTSYMRGFYIKKDVYRIAICPKYYQSYLYMDSTLKFFTESYDDYATRRDALNADPVENIKYEEDKFTFDTKYTKNMFVVSRVAYDKGWSIKAKDNDTGKSFDVKVYKGNGGFVSFVAPKGNISYVMTYKTPYLTGSFLVSAFTVTGFFVSLVGYYLYVEKKKAHYIDNIHR